ncbi:NAD-dependent epimerase/dehydratase family protein [Candidatus Gracilibacteria bacterium]|nr:NAD-dependent epimerase/dehydratase family protein [Candidatus Gracilibacteria bacterium]
MSTILINGISTPLGAAVGEALGARPAVRLLGVASHLPALPYGQAELLTAQLSGQQLCTLLRAEAVDTVVHLDVIGDDHSPASRETAVRRNVLGTMEVLGACAAAGVRRVVVRSHALVYGAQPGNPALIEEHWPVAHDGISGIIRDYAEVDSFVSEFAHRQPEMLLLTLRCAPLSSGTFARYVRQPTPRTVFGFDPRVQLLALADAVSAFVAAVEAQQGGVYNIAADPLTLSQAIRLAGHQPLPVPEPLFGLSSFLGGPWTLGDFPFDRGFLKYSCVVDTTRARSALGWQPTVASADALALASDGAGPGDELARAEMALNAFLQKKSGLKIQDSEGGVHRTPL